MNLSPETRIKLESWANTPTWFTGHPNDTQRFFEFVDQYSRSHGNFADEAMIQGVIASITKTSIGDNNALEEKIRDRVSLMVEILDFLKVTGR